MILFIVLQNNFLVSHFDMGVYNYHHSSLALLNNHIHLFVVVIRKKTRVKSEVLPFVVVVDVHPKHIYRNTY